MCSHIFLNAGMEMDSLLDPVIDSSHRSYFAAVEHRALEALRPRPPGEAISIHHDWCDPPKLSSLCSANASLWLTTAVLVYDIAVEAYCPWRVRRQFGQRQEFPVPPRWSVSVARTTGNYE